MWKDSESSWVVDDNYNPSIAYLKNENKLLVYSSTESTETSNGLDDFSKSMGYQFDFDTKSWNTLCNFNDLNLETMDITPNRTARDKYRISNFQYGMIILM